MKGVGHVFAVPCHDPIAHPLGGDPRRGEPAENFGAEGNEGEMFSQKINGLLGERNAFSVVTACGAQKTGADQDRHFSFLLSSRPFSTARRRMLPSYSSFSEKKGSFLFH